jgi:hypothetical protein
MNMKLGLIYMTGSGKKGQRDKQPKTVTFGFFDADATGSPFQYVKLAIHSEDDASTVAYAMEDAAKQIMALGNGLPATGPKRKRHA